MAYRFVILQHRLPTEDHWDVMLETDSGLTTWSIPPQNSSGQSFVCSALPLPMHRKEYLNYEGTITGCRGVVTRVDSGTYEQISSETFMLYGTNFIGKLTLEKGMMTFDIDNTPQHQ